MAAGHVVVGKEFVRAMVAFLTNDFAAVRARGRLVIIGAHVHYTRTHGTGEGTRQGAVRPHNRPGRVHSGRWHRFDQQSHHGELR
jgi:hypothetical protein